MFYLLVTENEQEQLSCLPSRHSMKSNYKHTQPFKLEGGGEIADLQIAYHTYGVLNETKSNVIWVCHALTANSDPADWWKGVVGEGNVINPSDYFIVCANIIGSPYGSTAPDNYEFPLITIKDMVQAHILLRKNLGIDKISLLMGGSMGGYQVLEWALTEPDVIDRNFVIATSAAESAWGIAIHTAQRMAIEADPIKGLAAARAIGMLTYRNFAAFAETQTDSDTSKIENFKAESYMRYQGEKLVNRFNAASYYALTKSMDSHNIARGRTDSIQEALKKIAQPTLILGITSDQLCPITEQELMAAHIPNNVFERIESKYGHDGFLIEAEKISAALKKFLS